MKGTMLFHLNQNNMTHSSEKDLETFLGNTGKKTHKRLIRA